jgi:hypothetical protein
VKPRTRDLRPDRPEDQDRGSMATLRARSSAGMNEKPT